jgi:hypothetical protein
VAAIFQAIASPITAIREGFHMNSLKIRSLPRDKGTVFPLFLALMVAWSASRQPIGIQGTVNSVAKFIGTASIGNSSVTDNGTTVSSTEAGSFVGLTSTTTLASGGVITPTAISGNVNNYNPTNLATATLIRQSASSTATVTGLQGGVAGRLIVFCNIGSSDISILDQSGSSTAANRFAAQVASSVLLTGGGNTCAFLLYDGTASRWRIVALNTNAFNVDIEAQGGVSLGAILTDTGFSGNPTVSACGTAPAVLSGGSFAGTIRVGTAATGCTITFPQSMTTPSCTVSTHTFIAFTYAETGSALTLTNGTLTVTGLSNDLSGVTVDYHCVGH